MLRVSFFYKSKLAAELVILNIELRHIQTDGIAVLPFAYMQASETSFRRQQTEHSIQQSLHTLVIPHLFGGPFRFFFSLRSASEQEIIIGLMVLFDKIHRQSVQHHIHHLHISFQQLPESQVKRG